MIHLIAFHRPIYRRILIQCILLFLLTPAIESQVLKGRITDKSGQPVQYATVYIQELKHGTTSNTKGDYEIKLPAGKYMVLFQSLGYEPYITNVSISDSTLLRDIILYEQFYEIPEVKIVPSGEDPAYLIMRRAIGLAPYHLNQVSHYKAEVYLKGNLLIKRIPKLLQRSMRMSRSDESATISAGGKPDKASDIFKEGDSYLMESFNEIEFTAPNSYVQKVISFNSTFPEQGNEVSPMDYIQASFYQPVLADMAISPLSPQAFSHYNFRYLGSSLQGNYTVNKIEVTPKRKSQQLFTGTVYIIEELWCLQSVDLTNENLAGKIRVRELYIPVEENIWMPVSHQFDILLGILGIKADIGYSSSVRYLEVKPNNNLPRPAEIASGYAEKYTRPDTLITETRKKIEKILQKEEMTNRDMVRLANLMEKESETSIPDTAANKLEIKDNITRIIEKDAGKKDSTYWAEIRPVPLSEIELKSLRVSDSLKTTSGGIRETKTDTLSSGPQKNKGKFKRSFNNIVSGYTWSDTTGFRFTNGGLLDPGNLSFNTVDGFVYGIDFRISKSSKNQNTLSFYPDIKYAFSRKKIMWRVNVNYDIPGMKPARIFINTGSTSKDLNTSGGINPFLNTVSTLMFRRNYLKLYQSKYFILGFEKELTNGLKMEISASYEERLTLQNNTDFSIFRPSRAFTDNIPVNRYLEEGQNLINFADNRRHFDFGANITFTPNQKYRVFRGNKIPGGSDWPVFRLIWKHGMNLFPTFSESYRHFDVFRFEVSQEVDMSAFSEFKWRFRTGGFADSRGLPYYDFFHFNAQPLNVLLNDYSDAFMLPSIYSLSTPEMFGEIHLKYTSPYILLKFLPGLSNTLIRENLTLSLLKSRFYSNYTEIGYSLSEVFLIGEIGFYAGFNNLKYSNCGVKLILRLN